MTTAKWLDGYSGQSVDELLALAPEYRIDSIVLAFEMALQQRTGELNEVEMTVLAVEAYEREVNNGGHDQFFHNAPEHAAHIVAALERIGCPQTADIARKAIELHRRGGDDLVDKLGEQCDDPFYNGSEPIADRLFDYLSRNRRQIRIA